MEMKTGFMNGPKTGTLYYSMNTIMGIAEEEWAHLIKQVGVALLQHLLINIYLHPNTNLIFINRNNRREINIKSSTINKHAKHKEKLKNSHSYLFNEAIVLIYNK